MRIGNHDVHDAAEKISRYDALSFQLLCESIRDNGLLVPIVLYQGKVLDGRHRYRACLDVGVEPRFVELEDEPYACVAAFNLIRRHSDEGQRALDARRLLRAQNKAQASLPGVSDECAAMAAIVERDAVSEVVQAVETGEVSLNLAAHIARMEPDDQAAALERLREQEQPEPVRAESTQRTVTSRAVELTAKSIEALRELVRIGESQRRNSAAAEGVRVVRLLCPEVGP